MMFPDIGNRLNNPGAPQQQGQGGDAQLFRQLNERMNQQEARLRRECENRLAQERERIRGNRLFNMTGDQVRAMGNEEFQRLFNDMANQLGVRGDGVPEANAIPVEDVMEDEEH